MKRVFDNYYNSIEKATEKLLRKIVGCKSIVDVLAMTNDLRKELQEITKKDVHEITNDDLLKYKLSYKYAKWRTLSKIMDTISGAIVIKEFISEEYEANC